MTLTDSVRQGDVLDRAGVLQVLAAETPDDVECIRVQAEKVLLARCGPKVYYRGLIEFSNICSRDCFYCGIRAGRSGVRRYCMERQDIRDAACWCAQAGYGSVVLQSGERQDDAFVDFVEQVVRDIKSDTVSEVLPQGLGVTLCVGEQTEAVYRRFFEAGAHRYLLRIETTNPELFARMHPSSQSLATRCAALKCLKKTGFQVGTGVMIGLPGQTLEMLADDVEFFRTLDVDMIGMGPYIPHDDTPMAAWERGGWTPDRTFRTALLMVAAVRLALRDVNIAATTALQAMDPEGREKGLRFGANIIMPQLTPTGYRRDYLLYENKPCVDEDKAECRSCLERRIRSVGRELGLNAWGDSAHFCSRARLMYPRG